MINYQNIQIGQVYPPIKQILVHHDSEPPKYILAERQSSVGTYNVIVGRYPHDILTLYFQDNKQDLIYDDHFDHLICQ